MIATIPRQKEALDNDFFNAKKRGLERRRGAPVEIDSIVVVARAIGYAISRSPD
jgi:hypothetical protein